MMNSPLPAMPTPRPGIVPITPEKEAAQRAAVLKEAMSWIGTPYHQQGDIKGVDGAVDCSMLLVRAWVDSGMMEPFDPRPYPPNWHMHQSEERYLAWMQGLANETTDPKPGDIMMMTFGRCYSHSGILVDSNTIVHAHQKTGKCCMSNLHEPWIVYFDRMGQRKRPLMYFDIWAKYREVYGE